MEKNNYNPALGIMEPVFLASLPFDVEKELNDLFMNNNGVLSNLFNLSDNGTLPNTLDMQHSFSLPPEVRVLIDSINRCYPPLAGTTNDTLAFDLIVDRAAQCGQELDPFITTARDILSNASSNSSNTSSSDVQSNI